MCPLPHKQQALTEPLAQGSLSHSHFSESSKHAYSVPYQWSFAFYYYKTFVLEKKILKKRRSKLKTSQPNKRDVFKHPQSNIFVLENNRTSSNAGVFVQSLMNNQITDQYRPQCALLISMLGAGISEMISNTSPHIPWTDPTDRAVCAANSESFITRSWFHNSMIQCL